MGRLSVLYGYCMGIVWVRDALLWDEQSPMGRRFAYWVIGYESCIIVKKVVPLLAELRNLNYDT